VGGPATSPNKSKVADGGHTEWKNAKYLHNGWRHLHTVSYKDATRGRLWTTTARRLSAYNVVDSVETTTTACFYISRPTGTQQGRVLHPCVFTYALAYILLVTVLVCTYCVNFFGSTLEGHFFNRFNLYIIGCFLLFVYNCLVWLCVLYVYVYVYTLCLKKWPKYHGL